MVGVGRAAVFVAVADVHRAGGVDSAVSEQAGDHRGLVGQARLEEVERVYGIETIFFPKWRRIMWAGCSRLLVAMDIDSPLPLRRASIAGIPSKSDASVVSEGGSGEETAPESAHRDALWWAPQSALWARSRSARDLVQKLDRLLAPQPSGASSQACGVRVVVPGDRRLARERFSVYWDQFPRLLGADVSLMNGNLELLLVPERLVCAMFHFHLAHQAIAIPVGFVSSHPDHLRAAGALVSGRVRVKPGAILAAREEGGAEAVQDLAALIERLSSLAMAATPTKDGRPRLTLKKSI